MNFKKSTISCAVLVTLGVLSSNALAASDDTLKEDNNPIQTDIMVDAVDNIIILSQTSTGSVGNEVFLAQEGDFNGVDITIVGDDNVVEAVQIGSDNLALGSIVGDSNELTLYQEGFANESLTDITGNGNMVEVSQEGDGGPFGFIFNRSINTITGDDNEVVIDQGDGGN